METGAANPEEEQWTVWQVGQGEPLPALFQLKGFHESQFNGIFRVRPDVQVANRPTHWDETGSFFIYFQAQECTWALCPVVDDGQDMVRAAQQGSRRGFAIQKAGAKGLWQEFMRGAWEDRTVLLRSLAPLAQLAKEDRLEEERGDTAQALLLRVRQLWQDCEGVEVVLVREGSTARLAIRFTGDRRAQEAAVIGRCLLPSLVPKAIAPVGAETFRSLRSESAGCRLQRPAAVQVQEPPPVATKGQEEHRTELPKESAAPQEPLAAVFPPEPQDRPPIPRSRRQPPPPPPPRPPHPAEDTEGEMPSARDKEVPNGGTRVVSHGGGMKARAEVHLKAGIEGREHTNGRMDLESHTLTDSVAPSKRPRWSMEVVRAFSKHPSQAAASITHPSH